MKFASSLLIAVLFSNLIISQTTSIPDSNFEQALINLGYDTGPTDGVVLTSNISSVDSLWIPFKNISDLSGIEDFIALTYLNCGVNLISSLNLNQNSSLEKLLCYSNPITLLDVSQNPSLKYLRCSNISLASLNLTQNPLLSYLDCSDNQFTGLNLSQNTALSFLDCRLNQITNIDISQNTALTDALFSANQLTNIDVTQNTNLIYLACDHNQLTTLNVSQNSALLDLACYSNPLSSLNVSQNTSLISLGCASTLIASLNIVQNTALTSLDCGDNNQLSCLNVKNGNNINFTFFSTSASPNLTCINVDNVAFSTTNWTVANFSIDAGMSFSTSCNTPCTVGLDEIISSKLSIYPNPTTGNIFIDLVAVKQNLKATLINNLGQIILTKKIESTDLFDITIDAPKGVYFLQIETSKGEIKTLKIIKE